MATQPQLVMQTGPNPGKVFALEKPDLTIGRDIGNDIVINDAEVSRKHARLYIQGDQYILEDLGSTNGTFVNGARIASPHALENGDNVQMGENVTVVYEAPVADPNATAVMGSMRPAKPAPAPEPEPMFEPEPEPEPAPVEDFNRTMADEPPVFTPPPPAPTPAPAPIYEPEPVYEPEPAYEPPVMAAEKESTYTGPSLMDEPAYPAEEEPKKKSNRTAILAGCGCLLIFVCLTVAGALWYIDSNKLWCAWLGLC